MSPTDGEQAAGAGAVVARKALERLLTRAENAAAKPAANASRTVSLRLSHDTFPEYLQLARHADKIECNACLQLAERDGAVRVEWDSRAGERAHAQRILLQDGIKLAAHLGVAPRWALVADAEEQLAPYCKTYPVLEQVIEAWRKGNAPRGTRPGEALIWLQAIRVIEGCLANTGEDIPVRRLSANLFGDSKRIEALWPLLDALRRGEATVPAGDMEEVLSDLGLVKFPQTLLVAGELSLDYGGERIRASKPYLGIAPQALGSVQVDPSTTFILSVENLTTFHELARRPRAGAIVLYCGGMPSPSWKRAYAHFLMAMPGDARVYHWGDVDGGGFRIASQIACSCADAGRSLRLHGMRADAAPPGVIARRELTNSERSEILRVCSRWNWTDEAAALGSLAIEQEAVEPWWPE